MKKRELPQQVWIDETKLIEIMYFPDVKKLYLMVGHLSGRFYFRVEINGFWHALCEFMENKNKLQTISDK